MKLKKYTIEQLKEAVHTSVSMRQVLQKLNIVEAGGNYSTLQKAIKYFNLDTSHFTGKNLSGRSLPLRRKSMIEYLTIDSNIQSNKLRKYLIESQYFLPVCSCCNLTTWLNEPIPLELDHINGVNSDNRIENLRLLCPNCHAKTPTYRGRNIKPRV